MNEVCANLSSCFAINVCSWFDNKCIKERITRDQIILVRSQYCCSRKIGAAKFNSVLNDDFELIRVVES